MGDRLAAVYRMVRLELATRRFQNANKDKARQLVDERRAHLTFMIKIYKNQQESGRRITHEHPATAASWDGKSMTDFTADPDIVAVTSHQCECELTKPGPDGSPVSALKQNEVDI